MSDQPHADLPVPDFAQRRSRVLERLGHDVLLATAAPVRYSSRDTEFPYRPDSELLYLTGATEPGTVAALVGGREPRVVLFVRPRDPEAELWSGPRLGVEGAESAFGADEVHPSDRMAEILPRLLRGAETLHARIDMPWGVGEMVREALAWARTRGARRGEGPRRLQDPGEILDELRLVKAPEEVARIRRACAVTLEGHRAGVAALRPGAGEWEVEAEIVRAFRRAGARGSSFEVIVGSGPNACVLHYVENGRRMEEGDVVLIDAGAEVGHYHGDVTRSWPVSGRFTPEQRAVYRVVEEARRAAVEAVAPGATVAAVHQAAVDVLRAGLLDLGALSGDAPPDAHKVFFPHQTSHWLGLDVHDVGDYARNGSPRILEPGMVLTVEPGLYFREGDPTVAARAERFRGLGVRLEDDVLVTEDGRENLTAALPTDPDRVEELVGTLKEKDHG